MSVPEQPTPERDDRGTHGGNDGRQGPSATPTGGAPAWPPPPGQQPYAQAPGGQAFPPPCAQPPQPGQPYAQPPQAPYAQPGQPYAPQPQAPGGPVPPPPYAQPPYAQPPYPASPPQQQKKVWPWVLSGCLLVFLLVVGGCVGCVSCMVISDRNSNVSPEQRYGGGYGSPRDPFPDGNGRTDPYGGRGFGLGPNGAGSLTYEAIKDAAGDLPNEISDGSCSSGVYRVGADQDIKPGRYFFEGSMDAEGSFTVFGAAGSADRYDYESAVTYFGNYFADLKEGDLVVFMGPSGDRMYPADKADFKPEAPYESGLYRVGTDIPAGTYAIAVQDEAAAVAKQDCGAFVMNGIDFEDDPVIEAKYVVKGGTQTVTVKDGEWLELYAATATSKG